MSYHREARRLADAIHHAAAREHERRGPGRRRGTVLSTDPLRVDLHGEDNTLEADEITVGRTVLAGDPLEVGDVLILVEVARDAWVAVDAEGS